MIEEISKLVEDACARDTNKFGYGIWSHHIVYVVKYAKQLAAILGAEDEVVEIAALLHDYAGIKDSSLEEEHHIHGAIEAERILREYGYSREKIGKVKQCIMSHRGSVLSERKSPEAECIASADAMAHITQAASLLYLAYAKHCMAIDEGKAWVLSKLERSWNKLCPEAREIINDDYLCAEKFLCE
jgi:uncharacterized protein